MDTKYIKNQFITIKLIVKIFFSQLCKLKYRLRIPKFEIAKTLNQIPIVEMATKKFK